MLSMEDQVQIRFLAKVETIRSMAKGATTICCKGAMLQCPTHLGIRKPDRVMAGMYCNNENMHKPSHDGSHLMTTRDSFLICLLLQIVASLPTPSLAQQSTVETTEQPPNQYAYRVNLGEIADDKLNIELTTPTIGSETTTFFIPKIVPGIYGAENYGQFVSEVKAYDAAGNPLKVANRDKNSWTISDAKKLNRLTYTVDGLLGRIRGQTIACEVP